MSDRQMKVWEFRQSRQPYTCERLSRRDPIAPFHAYAVLHQMTVLGLPSISVRDDDAITAFAICDRWRICRRHHLIRHAVARPKHLSARRGKDVDPRTLSRQRR